MFQVQVQRRVESKEVLEVDGGGLAGGEGKDGEGDGEREAAGAGAARVQVVDAVLLSEHGLVGVAADDEGDSSGLGGDVQVCERMDEVDEVASELDGFCWG